MLLISRSKCLNSFVKDSICGGKAETRGAEIGEEPGRFFLRLRAEELSWPRMSDWPRAILIQAGHYGTRERVPFGL
jgi:hypothetical protein